MQHSSNVITNQRRMYKLYPSFVITNKHIPLDSIYIIIRTNQEQITTSRTKQEQLKKESLQNNDL